MWSAADIGSSRTGRRLTPRSGLTAINIRISELEAELADLLEKRTRMEVGVTEPKPQSLMEALKEATYREVQQAAKDAGVSAKGSRDQVVARIQKAVA